MNILALDLATNTGFAHSGKGTCWIPTLGTWTLATDKEIRDWGKSRMVRRLDPRVVRLAQRLHEFKDWVDVVVFEDVQFQSYTQQCQLWSSLRSAIWLTFCEPLIVVECVPVQTLKLFAANHGGATKEMMINAVVRSNTDRFSPGDRQGRFWDKFQLLSHDDNAADAYHLFTWATTNLGRVQPRRLLNK